MAENEKNNEAKKEARGEFFIVPNRIFELGLTPYELSVLLYLMMRADRKTNSCFPSEKGIARACGMGFSTITRIIKSLEGKGLINVEKQYSKSKNGLNRQTSNLYTLLLCESSPLTISDTPPYSKGVSPLIAPSREINKTKPNKTKLNISIPTEQSAEPTVAVEEEKERISFCELKRSCFENLKSEKGFDDEKIALLERALEHLWFKNGDEYQGKKYTQSELRELLCDKTTPELLACSVESLRAAGAGVRSPVGYLSKCILGGLVNGMYPQKSVTNDSSESPQSTRNVWRDVFDIPPSSSHSSFDSNDFFAAALRKSYGDDFEF